MLQARRFVPELGRSDFDESDNMTRKRENPAAPVRRATRLRAVADRADSHDAELRERLLRSVRRICPRWLSDSVEDITQTALLQVMRIRDSGDGERSLAQAYLDRVAYGCTVDEMRRQRRKPVIAADGQSGLAAVATGGATPEAHAASRQIGRGIQRCLVKLVRPRRRAVTLYLVGNTVPSIGRLFGWSTKKTESLVYRGLADLRRCLVASGLEP